MRDPERIDKVLEAVRAAWAADPDIRLGQLLYNACRESRANGIGPDLFNIEEDQLVDGLRIMENSRRAWSDPVVRPLLNEFVSVSNAISDVTRERRPAADHNVLVTQATSVFVFLNAATNGLSGNDCLLDDPVVKAGYEFGERLAARMKLMVEQHDQEIRIRMAMAAAAEQFGPKPDNYRTRVAACAYVFRDVLKAREIGESFVPGDDFEEFVYKLVQAIG